MKACSFIVIIFTCCICRYTSVEIMPELKKNNLNFGYGINFKYEGMLVHYFDRFYVVMKFILPTVNDLKFLLLDLDKKCDSLNADLSKYHYWKKNINNVKIFCEKIVLFIDFYEKQISSYDGTSHKILNVISLILPYFPKARKEMRGIITSLITGFIGLAYEGISSYLNYRRQKDMHESFIAMENKVNLQCNRIIHLENLMVMYGICNSETFEKLIHTVHKMHSTTTWNKKNICQ